MMTYSDDENQDESTKKVRIVLSRSDSKDVRNRDAHNLAKASSGGPSPMSFFNMMEKVYVDNS